MKTAGPRIVIAMIAILSAMAFVGAFRTANGLDNNGGYVATHHPEKFAEAYSDRAKMSLYIGIGLFSLATGLVILHKKKAL